MNNTKDAAGGVEFDPDYGGGRGYATGHGTSDANGGTYVPSFESPLINGCNGSEHGLGYGRGSGDGASFSTGIGGVMV